MNIRDFQKHKTYKLFQILLVFLVWMHLKSSVSESLVWITQGSVLWIWMYKKYNWKPFNSEFFRGPETEHEDSLAELRQTRLPFPASQADLPECGWRCCAHTREEEELRLLSHCADHEEWEGDAYWQFSVHGKVWIVLHGAYFYFYFFLTIKHNSQNLIIVIQKENKF